MSMADTDLDYHDDGYIEIVLKMMGLMCDNQNTVLQVCMLQNCNTATGQYSYIERGNHLILDLILYEEFILFVTFGKQKHS